MKTEASSLPESYLTEATVAPNGSLVLASPSRLPLKPGEKVSLLIMPLSDDVQENSYPLQGTVTHYEDPFGPATALEDWEALQLS